MLDTDTYKYLSVHQSRLVKTKIVKINITEKYIERVKKMCKTKLCEKNIIKAINTYAVPVIMYTFGVIKWTKTDIEYQEREVLLTNSRCHHPKAATERINLSRHLGGRGLADLQTLESKYYYKNISN